MFGGGRAYVARAGGTIFAVDLATARVTPHRPRRALAKGEDLTWPHWLGEGLLGVRGRIVDTQTWRARLLEPGAKGIVAAGTGLVAYGARGLTVYTRGGRVLYRPVTERVNVVRVHGRYAYAWTVSGARVVDVTAHRVRAIRLDGVWTMLD